MRVAAAAAPKPLSMFTMRIEMAVPAELDRRVLRERLERVAADLRVDLTLTDVGER